MVETQFEDERKILTFREERESEAMQKVRDMKKSKRAREFENKRAREKEIEKISIRKTGRKGLFREIKGVTTRKIERFRKREKKGAG